MSIALLEEIESGGLLQAQLQNAFDVSKISSVFETFLKVIKEQQAEIAVLHTTMNEKVDDLNKQLKLADEKIARVDGRVDEAKAELVQSLVKSEERIDGKIDEEVGSINQKLQLLNQSLELVKKDCVELTLEMHSKHERLVTSDLEETRGQLNTLRTELLGNVNSLQQVVAEKDGELSKNAVLELQTMKDDIEVIRKDLLVAAEAAAIPKVVTNQIIVDDTASTVEIEKININIHRLDENIKLLEPQFDSLLVEINKDRLRIDNVMNEVIYNKTKIENNQAVMTKNLDLILSELNSDRGRLSTVEGNVASQGGVNQTILACLNDFSAKLSRFNVDKALTEVLSDESARVLADCEAKMAKLESNIVKQMATARESKLIARSKPLDSEEDRGERERERESPQGGISAEEVRQHVVEILAEFNITKPLHNLEKLDELHNLEKLDELLQSGLSLVNVAPHPATPSESVAYVSRDPLPAAQPVVEEPVAKESTSQELSEKKKRDRMDAERLMLVSSHKRRELCGWLKVKGKNILKEKELKKKEREALMSVPDKIKGIETEVAMVLNRLEKQEKVMRALDKHIQDKIRQSLPNDFSAKFSGLTKMLQKIDELGGVEQLFKRITLLQTELQSISKTLKESADDMKIFTSKKDAISEPFMRLIRQQLGPCEPDSDSRTIIDIINRIHKVNEEAVKLCELDEILSWQRDDSKIVNKRYEKLHDTIVSTCEAMLSEYTAQSVGLQVKIDPKEFRAVLKEAEAYTNKQLNAISATIYETYDEKIKKLEDVKLSHLNDGIKRLEYETFQLKDKLDMVGKTYDTMGKDSISGGKMTVGHNGLNSTQIEAAIKNHVSAFAEDIRYQKEKDKEVFRSMSEEMHKLQSQLEARPDKDNVQQMIGYLETAFKKRFGGDMTNLRTTVLQIVKAVQEKAGREEVATMIADKVETLETQISGTLIEDNSKISLAVKCLGCGQPTMYRQRVPTAAAVAAAAAARSDSPSLSIGSNGTGQSDSMSVGSMQSKPSLASSGSEGGGGFATTSSANEFIKTFYDIAGGKVGLKALQSQGQPFSPKANPLSRSQDMTPYGHQQALKKSPFKGSPTQLDRTTTPLYQKARAATHMKELVKPPSIIPTTQGSQSMYVMDGNGWDSTDDVSLGSKSSQKSSHSLPLLHKSPNKTNNRHAEYF